MKKVNKGEIVRNIIIIALAVLVVLLVGMMLLWRYSTKDLIYTAEQMEAVKAEAAEQQRLAKEESFSAGRVDMIDDIKSRIEVDNTKVVRILMDLYPDYIVAYSGTNFHFVPRVDTIPKNDYDEANLVVKRKEPKYPDEDGELISISYEVDGKTACRKGIDVSSYQGDINWKKVAAEGVEFAFIRVMYRGYGTGALKEDTKWRTNIKNARAAGIKVGVYGVTMATTKEEAVEEAKYMLKLTDGYTIDLPYVLDIEIVEDKDSRTYYLDADLRTDTAVAFLETIKEAGKTPMIYHNTEMGAVLLDYERLKDYPVWFAHYTAEMYWPYQYDIWQYGLCDVSGVEGKCDVNLWLRGYEDYLD